MFLNVHLIRKADDYALQRCEVAEVVEISHEDFNELKCNPLKDYSFITENKDKLEYENVSTVPCIMFIDGDGDDGILVDPQGYDYARYSAYISNARQLCRLGQYPSLDDYNRDMQSLVEHYVSEVLSEQKDGQAILSLSAVGDYYQSEYQGFLDHELFQNMMMERPEFETIEENCGDLFINVKAQYLHNQMRELTQQEVDVICAKHVLWLNDAGGERANFQNCYLNNLNLYGRDLSNSYCEGAQFENCDMHSTDFSNAEMESVKFNNCYMQDIFANKTNFIQADFIGCDISNSVVCDSILTSAAMQNCKVRNTQITNCQLDGFEHPDTDMSLTSCVTGQTEEQTNSLNYS